MVQLDNVGLLQQLYAWGTRTSTDTDPCLKALHFPSPFAFSMCLSRFLYLYLEDTASTSRPHYNCRSEAGKIMDGRYPLRKFCNVLLAVTVLP